ncbi:DUF6053 domain-containing protein [Lysobacter enzymogenes]
MGGPSGPMLLAQVADGLKQEHRA